MFDEMSISSHGIFIYHAQTPNTAFSLRFRLILPLLSTLCTTLKDSITGTFPLPASGDANLYMVTIVFYPLNILHRFLSKFPALLLLLCKEADLVSPAPWQSPEATGAALSEAGFKPAACPVLGDAFNA